MSRIYFMGRSIMLPLLLAFSLCLLWFAPLQAKPLKVVTTFTIIADMAAEVAGDAAEVVSITKPGVDIHNYQPTAQDLLRGYDADLLLWNGMNLELWFEQFYRQLEPIARVQVSQGITPINITPSTLLSTDESAKPNPHAWMSPTNAMIYVDNIRDALSQHDPENRAVYYANAAHYKQKIAAMMEPLKQQIAAIPPQQRWLVTSEGAFSYFAADFGMRELYLWPMNTDQVGTPQQVRQVIDIVKQENIPVVFSESTVSPKPMLQVARETGSHYGGVLYVDSLSTADGPVPHYLDLLAVTTRTIMQGFRATGVLSKEYMPKEAM